MRQSADAAGHAQKDAVRDPNVRAFRRRERKEGTGVSEAGAVVKAHLVHGPKFRTRAAMMRKTRFSEEKELEKGGKRAKKRHVRF